MNFKSLALGVLTAGCLSTITAMAQSSDGGLFVEPTITYEKGDSTVNYPSPLSNSTGTADGFGIGARLGVHLNDTFFLGGDARYSMPRFKDSSVDYDADSVATNYGPVLGFQMPDWGVRIWGTYIAGGELNPKADGSFDVKFEDAKGYRIGVGYRIESFSVNLEYQDLKYGNAILEKLGPFNNVGNFSNTNLKNRSWILSASFPMAL